MSRVQLFRRNSCTGNIVSTVVFYFCLFILIVRFAKHLNVRIVKAEARCMFKPTFSAPRLLTADYLIIVDISL